ncbi:30S ribosomal protein S3 [Candidatus Uhrbacteria bacterium]|nr:30S ribosomal protein S3 [Candidatus Uhrbacteria bacterium]
MGQKVHPNVFRIGVIRGWDGVWFASKKGFMSQLKQDVEIRDFLRNLLKEALVDHIEIERSRQEIRLVIHSAKPGVIIGRGGAGIEDLTQKLKKVFFRGRRIKMSVNVKEISKPSLSSQVIAQQIAVDIEKRMPFRRVMKMAIDRALKAGALGVKIRISGRLNGADIARRETIAQGKIPLHNLRSDIDFASLPARTIWGAIGVKVWINRGEVFDK